MQNLGDIYTVQRESRYSNLNTDKTGHLLKLPARNGFN